jgi:hypothetical protein
MSGEKLLAHAQALGLEGIVSKRRECPYRSVRCVVTNYSTTAGSCTARLERGKSPQKTLYEATRPALRNAPQLLHVRNGRAPAGPSDPKFASRNLPFPKVTDPEAPPLRPERHVPNSIATMRRRPAALPPLARSARIRGSLRVMADAELPFHNQKPSWQAWSPA